MTPSCAEVAKIARRTAQRLHQAFRKQGRTSPWDGEAAFVDSGETDAFSSDQPGLFACYQAAAQGIAVSGERAGQPLLRVVAGGASSELTHNSSKSEAQPVAEALGVSVYAKQLVHGHDRAQLERFCRYVLRPPLSQERLALGADGRLTLTLKNVWKDGTRALLLEPHDLLVRLCAAVPPAWFNLIRYFGVLPSHSRERAEVCPKAPSRPGRFAPEPAAGDQLSLQGLFGDGKGTTEPEPRKARSRWSWKEGLPRRLGDVLSVWRPDALGRGRHRAGRYRQTSRQTRPRSAAASRTAGPRALGSARVAVQPLALRAAAGFGGTEPTRTCVRVSDKAAHHPPFSPPNAPRRALRC